MQLKSPTTTEILGTRNKASTGTNIALPEEWIAGFSNHLTDHRFVTVTAVPEGFTEFGEGAQVLAHEMDQTEVSEKTIKIPLDYVHGVREEGKMRMLQNRVLIKLDPPQEKVGLIWIADTCQRPSDKGEVVALGPDCKEITIGDRVLIHATMGLDVNLPEYRGACKSLREFPTIEEIDSILGVLPNA